jgi:hypothetical protein
MAPKPEIDSEVESLSEALLRFAAAVGRPDFGVTGDEFVEFMKTRGVDPEHAMALFDKGIKLIESGRRP